MSEDEEVLVLCYARVPHSCGHLCDWFRKEEPTVPLPSPMVGALACCPCPWCEAGVPVGQMVKVLGIEYPEVIWMHNVPRVGTVGVMKSGD